MPKASVVAVAKPPPRRAAARYIDEKDERKGNAGCGEGNDNGGGAVPHLGENSLADLRQEFGRKEPTRARIGSKEWELQRPRGGADAADALAVRSNSFDGLIELTDAVRGRGTSMDAVMQKYQNAQLNAAAPIDAAFSDNGRAAPGLFCCFCGKSSVREGRGGGDGSGGDESVLSVEEGTQSALMFLKPHCSGSKAVLALVKAHLASAGVSVLGEGVCKASDMKRHGLVDAHYGAIANRAVRLDPRTLAVPPEGQAAFQARFGLGWAAALDAGLVHNASTAAFKLNLSDAALEKRWRAIPREDVLKLGGGFYVGQLGGEGGPFVVNGFYLAMRSAFVAPGACVRWLVLRWRPEALSWADFRLRVVGATDPSEAKAGSIRRAIFDGWKALGLAACPGLGQNGVHASASPLEGLFERVNWLRLPNYASDR